MLVALVGTLHGLAYVPVVKHVTPDSVSYQVVAQAILDGHYTTKLESVDVTGLRIPPPAVGAPEHQTYRTPGYPLVLAAVGGGESSASRAVLYLVQAAFFGLTVWLLVLTSARLWGPRVGLLAGILYALDPYSKRYVSLVLSEATAGLLFAVAVWTFARAWKTRALRWWAVTGAAAGALSLVRPLFAIAIPLAAVAGLAASGRFRTRLAVGATTLACGIAVIAPWAGWMNAVSGKVTLSSFGEGWNLLLAAHGEGPGRTASTVSVDPAFVRDFTSVRRFTPSAGTLGSDADAHARYLVRADAEQSRLARKLYLHRLGSEPGRVVEEVAYRAYFLWMAHEDWFQPSRQLLLLPLRIVDWLTLGLACLGLGVGIRRGGAGRLLAIFILAFTAVNALHHVEARYAYPVRGLWLAFAALGLVALVRVPRARHP